MSRYDLYDYRRKTEFRPLGGHFANFSSSVIRISEEIFSQQTVCMSSGKYVGFMILAVLFCLFLLLVNISVTTII
jgi:hypothetical protein